MLTLYPAGTVCVDVAKTWNAPANHTSPEVFELSVALRIVPSRGTTLPSIVMRAFTKSYRDAALAPAFTRNRLMPPLMTVKAMGVPPGSDTLALEMHERRAR